MSRFNGALLILLIVQVLLILFMDRPCSTGRFRADPAEGDTAALFPDFQKEKAHALVIRKGTKTITLNRADTASPWIVTGRGERVQADTFAMETLLASLTRLKGLDVVSRNPEKVAVYGLDDPDTIHLTVRDQDGAIIMQLQVGKDLGALRGTYVKVPDRSEVYLETESLRHALDKEGDWIAAWREKTVLAALKEQIRSVRIAQGSGETIELAYRSVEDGSAQGAWWLLQPEEGKAKSEAVDPMLDALCALKARDFAERGVTVKSLNLTSPDLSVVVGLDLPGGGRERRFDFTANQGGIRYLLIDGEEASLCKVASYLVNPLLCSGASLLE